MKRSTGWIAAGIVVAAAAGGGYAAYDYFTGNHVEVREVIAESASAASTNQPGVTVADDQLQGEWVIAPGSEVYLSLTTSKETVNMTMGEVTGTWNLNPASPVETKAEGKIDLSGLDSGNPTRDGHITGDRFLNIAEFPEAAFTAATFEGLPEQWEEGVPVSFTMNGMLNVRGIDKEVAFESQAVYEQGQVKVEGTSVVTFADFGMANPHQVVVETENEVTIQLQLLLDRGQA